MLQSLICPIHREGVPFILIFAAVAAFIYWLYPPLGLIAWGLTGWCIYFFRDPKRMVPTRAGLIMSPADGVVQAIVPVVPPIELDLGEAPLTRVSIFMNVFNVHVNRTPVEGMITKTHYYPGKFFNASLDKASEHNERQGLALVTKEGHKIGVVQIAGLIARRICCEVKTGQMVKTGERFGIIRFGSRVDIYLPLSIHPFVMIGQKTIAGETVIADYLSQEEPRSGRLE